MRYRETTPCYRSRPPKILPKMMSPDAFSKQAFEVVQIAVPKQTKVKIKMINSSKDIENNFIIRRDKWSQFRI